MSSFPAATPQRAPRGGLPAWAYPAVVALVTFLAFAPALQAGFVNWDDDVNLVHNPHFRGLGLENLRWAFTTRLMGPWQPLSWISLGLDHELWGMDPRGYHLTNVLLHCAGAVMVYFVGIELLRRFFGPGVRAAAAVGALLFAIHPLRVESVAWITERRDVLSGVFFFASVLVWLRAHDEAARRPALTVAGLSYALLALPVLGFAQSGGQLAADRYSYLPCVPFALLGAAAVARWRRAWPVAALAIVALGVATFHQTRVWRDSRSLWTHALRVTPDSPRAHDNLGLVLLGERDLAGAERHFRTAVRAWPWYAHAHNNLAATLYEQGRVQEAIAHWRRFLELAPNDPKAPAVREALAKLEGSGEGGRKR